MTKSLHHNSSRLVIYSQPIRLLTANIAVVSPNDFNAMLHTLNIITHVIAGSVALILGVLTIFYNERISCHRKLGTWFLYFMSVVVGTGFIGWLFFRSDPFLLILVIISGYDAFAGYRIIKLKERTPQLIDVIVPVLSLGTAVIFLLQLADKPAGMGSAVVTSTMIGLSLVTLYDISKYFFLHRFVKTWWLYEHIYKMIAAFSAILSAFTATVITVGRPYTQIGPGMFCMALIAYFITRKIQSSKFKV